MARALRVPPLRETKQLELTVDGQQFRVVHDVGDGTGTPLLLMNGIGAKLELLQPFVDLLSPQRDIIQFDVPGVGGSPTARHPYRLKGVSAQNHRHPETTWVREADVLGISWGGGLAQQFAYSESAHCRKLVLVSTATGSIMVPAIIRRSSPR